MSPFRRRSRAGSGRCAEAPAEPPESAAEGVSPAAFERELSLVGAYVTDGRALFHVQHAIWDRKGGAPLFELEDCRTLELIVCPCNALDGVGVRVAKQTASVVDGGARGA